MAQKQRLSELRTHKFEGKPPNGHADMKAFAEAIPIYDSVDRDLLYQGDAAPFHIVLDIAQEGAISANGLLYDAELMQAMEDQLPGLGGLRGHMAEGDYSAFPIEVIDWVGHERVGDTLYAKGYIAPGPDREAIRRMIARKAEMRTSLDVQAFQEMVDQKKGIYRLKEIDFFTIDLVHGKKAALRKNQSGQAYITRETEIQEKTMAEDTPVTTTETHEAPSATVLREQLNTLTQERDSANERVQLLETQLQEARQYAVLVGEIRMSLGFNETASDADLLPRITEMYSALTNLGQILGSDVSIEVRVAELMSFQQETIRQTAERELDALVGSYTESWNVSSEKGKEKVAKFHKNFKRSILSEAAEGETRQQTAERLWAEEYQEMAQDTLQAISGPGAVVPPMGSKKESNKPSKEEIDAMASRFVRP